MFESEYLGMFVAYAFFHVQYGSNDFQTTFEMEMRGSEPQNLKLVNSHYNSELAGGLLVFVLVHEYQVRYAK